MKGHRDLLLHSFYFFFLIFVSFLALSSSMNTNTTTLTEEVGDRHHYNNLFADNDFKETSFADQMITDFAKGTF